MSAPQTNLKEQKRRHRGPLMGIRAVVGYALALLALLVIWVFATGDSPDAVERADDPTAVTEPAEPAAPVVAPAD